MTLDDQQLPLTSSAPTAKPRKHVLWKWSIAVTVVALGYLVWQCGSGLVAGRNLSNAAVQQFHNELNDEQYQQIWDDADGGFQRSDIRETFKFLEGVHRKLGKAQNANVVNLMVQATPGGTYIIADYKTKFEHGEAEEKFVWTKTAGHLKLHGYNVQSKVFVIG